MFNDQPRVRATVLAKPTPTTLVVQLAGDVQVTIDGVAPVGTSIDVYADDVVQRGNGYELVNFTGYRLTHPRVQRQSDRAKRIEPMEVEVKTAAVTGPLNPRNPKLMPLFTGPGNPWGITPDDYKPGA